MSKDALTTRKSQARSKEATPPVHSKSSGKLHPLLQNSVERLSKPKGKSFDETWLDASSSTNLQQDSRESLRSVAGNASALIHELVDRANEDSNYSLTRLRSVEDTAVRNSLGVGTNSSVHNVPSTTSVPSASSIYEVTAKRSSRKSATENDIALLRGSAAAVASPPKKPSTQQGRVLPHESAEKSVAGNASKFVGESAAPLAKVSSEKALTAHKSSSKSVIERANKLLRDSITALGQSGSSKLLEEPPSLAAASTTTVAEANSILNAVMSEIERTDSAYLMPDASAEELHPKTFETVGREKSVDRAAEPTIVTSKKAVPTAVPSTVSSAEVPKRKSLAQVASSRESAGKLAKFLQESVHWLSQPKRDYSAERQDVSPSHQPQAGHRSDATLQDKTQKRTAAQDSVHGLSQPKRDNSAEREDPRQDVTPTGQAQPTPRSDPSPHKNTQKQTAAQQSPRQMAQPKTEQSAQRPSSRQDAAITRQAQLTPRSDQSLQEKTQERTKSSKAVPQDSAPRLSPKRDYGAERETSGQDGPSAYPSQTAPRSDPFLHGKTQKRSTPLVPSTKPSAADASKPPTARSDEAQPAPTFTTKAIRAPSSKNKAPPKDQSFESSIPETKNQIPLPPSRTTFRQTTVEDRLQRTGPLLTDEATCFYKVDADGTEQVPRSMLSCTRYPLPATYVPPPPPPQKEPVASTSSQNIIMTPRPVKKVLTPMKKPGKQVPPKKGPMDPVTTVSPAKAPLAKVASVTRGSQTQFKSATSQESILSQLKEKADEIVEEAVEEADHELDEENAEEALPSLTEFYQEAENYLADMASEDAASDVLDRTASSNTRLTRSATSHRSPTHSTSQRRRHSAEGCAPLYMVPPVRPPGAARGKVCGDCLYGYKDEPYMYWDPTRALPSVGLGEPLIPPYRGNLEFDNRAGPAAQHILPYNILLDEQAAQFLESPLVRKLLRHQKLINADCRVNVPLKEYTLWQKELSRLQRELFNSVRKRRELEGLFGELMSLVGGTGEEEDLFRDLAKVGKLDYEELQEYLMVRVMQKQEWLMNLRDNQNRFIRNTNNQYNAHMFQHRRQQFLWEYEEREAIRLERYGAQQRARREKREHRRHLQFRRVNERRLRQMREDDMRRREIQEKMLEKAQRRHDRYIEFQEQSLPKELESPRYIIGQRPYRATREPSDRFLDVIAQALKPMPPLRKGEKRERGRVPHVMAYANDFKKPSDSRTMLDSPVPPRPLGRMSMHRVDEKQATPSATSSAIRRGYDDEEEHDELHTSEGVLDVPPYISHTADDGPDTSSSYAMAPSHGQDPSRLASRHRDGGDHDDGGHHISNAQPGHKDSLTDNLPSTPRQHHPSPQTDQDPSGHHISHIPHTTDTPQPTPGKHRKPKDRDGHHQTQANPSRHDLHASRAVMDVPSYVMDPSHGQAASGYHSPRQDLHSVPSLMDVPSRADITLREEGKSSSKHRQENPHDGQYLDAGHAKPKGRSKSPLDEAYADHHYTFTDVTPSHGRYRDQVLGIPSMVDSLEMPRHRSRSRKKDEKPKGTSPRHGPEEGRRAQVRHEPDKQHSPGRRDHKPGHSPVASDHLIPRIPAGAHSAQPSHKHIHEEIHQKITIITPSVESHAEHRSPLLDAAGALLRDILGEMRPSSRNVSPTRSLQQVPSSSSSGKGFSSSAHHKHDIHEALSEILTAGLHLQLRAESHNVQGAKSDRNLHPVVSHVGVKQAKSTSHLQQQRKKSEDDGFLHPHHIPLVVPSSQSDHSLRAAASHLSALSAKSSTHDVAGALLDDFLDLYAKDHPEDASRQSPAKSRGKSPRKAPAGSRDGHSPHRQLPKDPNSEEHKETLELLEALLDQYKDEASHGAEKSPPQVKSRQNLLKSATTKEPGKTSWPQEKIDVAVSVYAVREGGTYANFMEEPTSHLAHAVHGVPSAQSVQSVQSSHSAHSSVSQDKAEVVAVSPSSSVDSIEEAEEVIRRITLEAEELADRMEDIWAKDITNAIWDDAYEEHDQGEREDQSDYSHIHPSHGLHYPQVNGSSPSDLQFDRQEEASSLSNYALHHPESDMDFSVNSSQFPEGASSMDMPVSDSVRNFAEDVVDEAVGDAELREYPSAYSDLNLSPSQSSLEVTSTETIRWPYNAPTVDPLIPVTNLLSGEKKLPSGFTPLELSRSKILQAHPHILRGETERPLYGLPPPPKPWQGGHYDYDGGKTQGHQPHLISRGAHAHSFAAMIENIAQPTEKSNRFRSFEGSSRALAAFPDRSHNSIRSSSSRTSRSVSPSGFDRRSPSQSPTYSLNTEASRSLQHGQAEGPSRPSNTPRSRSPSGYGQEAKSHILPHSVKIARKQDFSTGESTVDLQDHQSRQASPTQSRPASPAQSRPASPMASPQASPLASYHASPVASHQGSPMHSQRASPTPSREPSPVTSHQASPGMSRQASPTSSHPPSPLPSDQASPVTSGQISSHPSREASPLHSRQPSPTASRTEFRQDQQQQEIPTIHVHPPNEHWGTAPPGMIHPEEREGAGAAQSSQQSRPPGLAGSPTNSATPSRTASPTHSPQQSSTQSPVPAPTGSPLPTPAGSPGHSPGPSAAHRPAPSRTASPPRSPTNSPRHLSPSHSPTQSHAQSPPRSEAPSVGPSPNQSPTGSLTPSRTASPSRDPPASSRHSPPQSRPPSLSNSPKLLSPDHSPTHSHVPTPPDSDKSSRTPSPSQDPQPLAEDYPQSGGLSPTHSTSNLSPHHSPTPSPVPGGTPVQSVPPSPTHSAADSRAPSPTHSTSPTPMGSPAASAVASPTHSPTVSRDPARTPSPTQTAAATPGTTPNGPHSPPSSPEDSLPQSRALSPTSSARGLSPSQSPTRSPALSSKQSPKASPTVLSPVDSGHQEPYYTPSGLVRLNEEELKALDESDSDVGLDGPHDTNRVPSTEYIAHTTRRSKIHFSVDKTNVGDQTIRHYSKTDARSPTRRDQEAVLQSTARAEDELPPSASVENFPPGNAEPFDETEYAERPSALTADIIKAAQLVDDSTRPSSLVGSVAEEGRAVEPTTDTIPSHSPERSPLRRTNEYLASHDNEQIRKDAASMRSEIFKQRVVKAASSEELHKVRPTTSEEHHHASTNLHRNSSTNMHIHSVPSEESSYRSSLGHSEPGADGSQGSSNYGKPPSLSRPSSATTMDHHRTGAGVIDHLEKHLATAAISGVTEANSATSLAPSAVGSTESCDPDHPDSYQNPRPPQTVVIEVTSVQSDTSQIIADYTNRRHQDPSGMLSPVPARSPAAGSEHSSSTGSSQQSGSSAGSSGTQSELSVISNKSTYGNSTDSVSEVGSDTDASSYDNMSSLAPSSEGTNTSDRRTGHRSDDQSLPSSHPLESIPDQPSQETINYGSSPSRQSNVESVMDSISIQDMHTSPLSLHHGLTVPDRTLPRIPSESEAETSLKPDRG